MRHLIVALLCSVPAASTHASMEFEGQLQEIRGEIGEKAAAAKQAHKDSAKALKETEERPQKDGAAPAIKIAVFARTEEKANLIRKLLEAKYCPAAKACTKTQVSVMGTHPADRSLFDRLVSVYKSGVDVVGMDAGMHVGSGSSVKLEHIREAGGIVHGISFAERDGFESPYDHSHTLDLCDAGGAGPGCGGH